jgi:hypothetical protein
VSVGAGRHKRTLQGSATRCSRWRCAYARLYRRVPPLAAPGRSCTRCMPSCWRRRGAAAWAAATALAGERSGRGSGSASGSGSGGPTATATSGGAAAGAAAGTGASGTGAGTMIATATAGGGTTTGIGSASASGAAGGAVGAGAASAPGGGEAAPVAHLSAAEQQDDGGRKGLLAGACWRLCQLGQPHPVPAGLRTSRRGRPASCRRRQLRSRTCCPLLPAPTRLRRACTEHSPALALLACPASPALYMFVSRA